MIKMNKQRYFDVYFRYSRASWGVLGCLGVSWGNKTDPGKVVFSTKIKALAIQNKNSRCVIPELKANAKTIIRN